MLGTDLGPSAQQMPRGHTVPCFLSLAGFMSSLVTYRATAKVDGKELHGKQVRGGQEAARGPCTALVPLRAQDVGPSTSQNPTEAPERA